MIDFRDPFVALTLTIISSLAMMPLAFTYNWLGFALAWWWFWIACLQEAVRRLRIKPKRSFDNTTEEWHRAMDTVIEMLENNYD